MKRLSILLLALLVFAVSSQAGATELIGPKAFSMGGAFTAVADDASSFYWNPAGLTRSGFMGGELSLGLSTNSFGDLLKFAQSFDNGDLKSIVEQMQSGQTFSGRLTGFVGANVKNFSGGIIINEDLRFDPENEIGYRHSEKIGNISLGVDVTRPILNLGRISLGANFKVIQRDEYEYEYKDGQFIMNENLEAKTDQELGLDAGSLIRITDMVNVALVARNMKLTLQEDNQFSMHIKAPESVTLGAAVKLPFPLTATVAADIEHIFPTQYDQATDILHVGVEKGFLLNVLSIRAGAYGPIQFAENPTKALPMFKDKITFTGGLGVNLLGLHVDAATGVSSDMKDFHGTVSASFKF